MLDLVWCRVCCVNVPRARIKKHLVERHIGESDPADRIWVAYQLSDTPRSFTAALQENGIYLAVISKEESERSAREATTTRRRKAKQMTGEFFRVYRENEIVAVTEQARVYKLTEQTTGDSYAGI
jgi:protein-L-isoaspartate O-methyltransferase